MQLTVPAYRDGGIWFATGGVSDTRAERVWSKVAEANPINAAAATMDTNPFAKYPEWVRPLFATGAMTMLDAGCGYGRVSIPLLEANSELKCVGVDASPVMLKRFVELAKDHGVDDRVELYCGNLDSLPFPDAYFQAALSCGVLLHLPKNDVPPVLDELRRVLATNARLVLHGSFPNALNPEGIGEVRNNFRRAANGPVRVYTRREVMTLLGGFAAVDVHAHQVTVLPRSIGPFRMPFAGLSRRVNAYCSRTFADSFRNAGWLVSHHDVVAIR
jgi:ubiquinone/menaquinone biosynthesis C-methylase UbiE